jgi:phosphoglucomutase
MTKMRNTDVEKIGDNKVLEFRDIQNDIKKDMITGKVTKTELPTSNVLYYALENDNWCCVRPSGTEPKIKLYMGVKGESESDAEQKLERLKEAMTKICQ